MLSGKEVLTVRGVHNENKYKNVKNVKYTLDEVGVVKNRDADAACRDRWR